MSSATEADAGSDAGAIRTRAIRQGNGYVLNGTKQFITSGKIAGLTLTFAVTDPDKGKRGISAFLIPTDRPGYHVDKVEHKLGQTASDTCALRFENLRLEGDLRLGEEGQGYGIALANLEAGRIGIGAQDCRIEASGAFTGSRRATAGSHWRSLAEAADRRLQRRLD